MLGGVFMNILLAVFIYIIVLFNYGEKYLPTKNLTDGVFVMDSVLMDVGLKTGDKVITINGEEPPERFNEILIEMLYSSHMTVDRNGKIVEIDIPEDLAGRLSENRGTNLLYRFPFLVASVPDSSHNASSGLQKMDMIVGINGHAIKYYDEFSPVAQGYKGQTITANVLRDGDSLNISLSVNEEGKIGVMPGGLDISELEKMGYYSLSRKNFTLMESVPAGILMAREQMVNYVRQFKLLFNPDTGAYKGLGGFITIGSFFPSTWDWYRIWQITAFLSIMLAVLNILPIPALDGGHVMFLFYEIITRRKPSDKFMEYAQVVGMVILLALLVFANGNDVMRWIESIT